MPLSIPSPSESVWMIGPFPLRAYAFAIIFGIIAAWWLLERRYRAKGGPADVSLDVSMWMIVFGIVGARIYHVITTPGPYFGDDGDLAKIIRVWEGGLGIWGAIALGAVGAWIGLRRQSLRMAPFADALAPGLLIAQAIGRLGNYFNQELYGKPTDLPWALEIAPQNIVDGYPAGTTFHPTFLYEMIWCLAGAILLVILERRFRLRGGQAFWLYVMIYTAGRTWIENLRIDEAQIVFGLRLNVWTSSAMFLLATALFVWRTRVVRTDEDADAVYIGTRDSTDMQTADSTSTKTGSENETGAQAPDASTKNASTSRDPESGPRGTDESAQD